MLDIVPLILIVADGARFDTIDAATRDDPSNVLSALAKLRTEGGLHPLTTAFPSVTGIAYAPFLTGRFPGPCGLPGLRWYDRAHARCMRYPYSRSYLGAEMRHLDGDLALVTKKILGQVSFYDSGSFSSPADIKLLSLPNDYNLLYVPEQETFATVPWKQRLRVVLLPSSL